MSQNICILYSFNKLVHPALCGDEFLDIEDTCRPLSTMIFPMKEEKSASKRLIECNDFIR